MPAKVGPAAAAARTQPGAHNGRYPGMLWDARLDAARAYCSLAAFVQPQAPVLAERLVESAAFVLAGMTPTWDERVELQRVYLADN